MAKMKIRPFNTWKSRFLADTDPRTGKKIAFRLRDFNERGIEKCRQLEEIKGIEFSVAYGSQSDKKCDTIITFKSLAAFPEAQKRSVYDSYSYKRVYKLLDGRVLFLNMGSADLTFTMPHTKENVDRLIAINGRIPRDPDYAGRPIDAFVGSVV